MYEIFRITKTRSLVLAPREVHESSQEYGNDRTWYLRLQRDSMTDIPI